MGEEPKNGRPQVAGVPQSPSKIKQPQAGQPPVKYTPQPGTPLHQSNDLVNKRYLISKQIGRGAMGEVYLAYDQERKAHVAMKYLLQPDREISLRRFKAEFDTLAHLRHPNITNVFDLARDHDTDAPFFTTEYVTGTSFEVATKELPLETTLALFVQTLRALEYLHGNNIWHFDIKAKNVLVHIAPGAKPTAKLIDFGIATAIWEGKRVGTPSYMAPEIINRAETDGRADIYSLGVLLYAALTRWNPFRSRDMEETFKRHLQLIPQAPSFVQPHLPQYLDAIIMRMLEKNLDDRYSTAAEVIADLNRVSPTQFAIETSETLESYVPSSGPFIGRIVQRAKLQRMLLTNETITPEPICLINGARGMGKTRLLHEAKAMAQMHDFHTTIISPHYHKDTTQIQNQLQSIIEQPYHNNWIGIDDLHLMVDDPRWSSVTQEIKKQITQSVMQHRLGDVNKQGKIVIVLTSSIESAELVNDFLPDSSGAIEHIELQPFTRNELKEYLSTVTGIGNQPDELINQLTNYTTGNPLFVTETIKTMIGQGLLFDKAGRWKSTTFEDLQLDLQRMRVPPNIESVVASRYARLSSTEQRVAGLMSVINQPITLENMQKFSGTSVEQETLNNLHKCGFIIHDPELHTYKFSSSVHSEAVYQQLSPTARSQWHDKLATKLLHDPQVDLEVLYTHQARGSNLELSRTAHWQLAQHYLETHRPAEAVPLLQAYLTMSEENVPHRCEAYFLLGRAKMRMQSYDAAIVAYRAGLENMTESEIDYWHPKMREAWANAAMKARRYDEAKMQFEQVLHLVEKDTTDLARQLRMRNGIAQALMYMANTPDAIQEAADIFTKTQQQADNLPLQEQLHITNNDLGHALMQLGRYDDAINNLQKQNSMFNKGEHSRLKVRALGLLAECYRRINQPTEARRQCIEAVRLAHSSRDPEQLMHLYTTMGNTHADEDHVDEAISYYQRALDLSSRVGDPSRAMALTLNLGLLYGRSSHPRRAKGYLESTIGFAEHQKVLSGLDQFPVCRAHLELAEMARHDRHFGIANKHLSEARQLAEKYSNCKSLLFWIITTNIEVLRDEGRVEEARTLTQEMYKHATTELLRNSASELEASLSIHGDEDTIIPEESVH